jgi:hypothetical protein
VATEKEEQMRYIARSGAAKLVALAAAIAAALVVATSATAAAPVIFTQTLTVQGPIPAIDCTQYGYGFQVDIASFTVTRHYIQFYDDTGSLTKEIRHIDFTGVLYRADNSAKWIPYAGNWTRTLDIAADTVVSTGLMRYSHPDGTGMVSLDAGRTVNDASTFDTLSDTGLTNADWERGVCGYLS